MRLYVDQMFRVDFAEGLRAEGHDVLRTAEAGQSNADDAEVLDLAPFENAPDHHGERAETLASFSGGPRSRGVPQSSHHPLARVRALDQDCGKHVASGDRSTSGERLMAVALQDERVLVTEDIDVLIEREFSPFRICAGTAGRLRVPRIAVGGEETGQSASLGSCSWAARLLLKNRPVARHFLMVGTSVAR